MNILSQAIKKGLELTKGRGDLDEVIAALREGSYQITNEMSRRAGDTPPLGNAVSAQEARNASLLAREAKYVGYLNAQQHNYEITLEGKFQRRK